MANHIKRIRKDMGKTPEEVASDINMTVEYYLQVENGSIEPPIDVKYKIAQSLGSTIADLLGLPKRQLPQKPQKGYA